MKRLFRLEFLTLAIVTLLAASCRTAGTPEPKVQPEPQPAGPTAMPPAPTSDKARAPAPEETERQAGRTEPKATSSEAPGEVQSPESAAVEVGRPAEETSRAATPPPSRVESADKAPAESTATRAVPEAAREQKSVSFLHPGEVLEFRMGWKIFSHIGDTRIETVEEDVDGVRRIKIKIAAKSRGLINLIFGVVNNSETTLDPSTGLPLSINIEGEAGGHPDKKLTVFDYEKHKVVHTDFIKPQKSATVDLPDKPAYDFIVTALMARGWNLKPGEKRETVAVFDEDFYDIELTATERERISTDLGTFDAVKLEAIQKGEQLGYFKKGGKFRCWVSEGSRPQLLKLQFSTNLGLATATLHRVTPGKD